MNEDFAQIIKRTFTFACLALAVFLDTLPWIPPSWQSSPGRILVSLLFAMLWSFPALRSLTLLFIVGLFADIMHDRIYGESPITLLIMVLIIRYLLQFASVTGGLSYAFFLTVCVILLNIIDIIYSYFVLDYTTALVGTGLGILLCITFGLIWYLPIRLFSKEQ